MKKLNRNNADINKLVDKKVAVRLVGVDAEIDFRKWLKENGICDNNRKLLIREGLRTEICYCVEGNQWDWWDWCEDNCFGGKGYKILEWEIAEEIRDAKPLTAEKKEILKSCLPQKTYTIRDIVDNKGKLYKDEYDTLYFYDDDLYCRTPNEKKFRPSLLNLQQMLNLELTEYKEEPIKITFEEALKEMETKVCRSMFSNRFITIYGTQFIDASNGEHTKLALPEITGDWIIIEK